MRDNITDVNNDSEDGCDVPAKQMHPYLETLSDSQKCLISMLSKA